MHALFGLLILAMTGAFLVFAFRQGQGVRPDKRRDSGDAFNLGSGGSNSNPPNHSGDGFGHG
jgi:hypothetical protein